MRNLNEGIARQANSEDDCKGRFWEGRFTSQALLDEAALAACMAYVDLNPIRAQLAATPETSDYTSVQTRIQALMGETSAFSNNKTLFPFIGHSKQNRKQDMPKGLPFELTDYLNLVDWTGRIIRDDKRGFMDNDLPPILQRLNIGQTQWFSLSTEFEQRFKQLVGNTRQLKQTSQRLGLQRSAGMKACKELFG